VIKREVVIAAAVVAAATVLGLLIGWLAASYW